MILPGWTYRFTDDEIYDYQSQNPSPSNPVLTCINHLAKTSRQQSCTVLAEFTWQRGRKDKDFRPPPENLGYLVFERGILRPENFVQRFTSSKAVRRPDGAYNTVARDVFSGARTVTLDGVRFLIFVCGENNFLGNIQKEKNRVVLRHPNPGARWTLDALRAADHDVVLNPAHTEMGNLGKMYKRWKWLSYPNATQTDRYCLFNSNIHHESTGGAAMYAFHNRRKELASPWGKTNAADFVASVVTISV